MKKVKPRQQLPKITFGIDWAIIRDKCVGTRKEPPPAIPQLQKRLILLKRKKDTLEMMSVDMDKFIDLPEHESLSQMIAITDLQIQHGKNALIF